MRELKNTKPSFLQTNLSGFSPTSDDRRIIHSNYFRQFETPETLVSAASSLDIIRVRQRVFRCPVSPLLYQSFKCNVELFHLQRCFSTQYKIPHHPSPPANQFTSSRSRRNKASLSSTTPHSFPLIYNVVSRSFAMNLVASSTATTLRSSLDKIKN